MNAITEVNPAASNSDGDTADIQAMLKKAFDVQREAYLDYPIPTLAERKDDLGRLHRMVSENVDAICAAISADYGNRSRHESLFAEIITALDNLLDTRKKVGKWMRPQSRHVD